MREVALVSRGGAAGSRRSEAANRTLRYRAFLSYSHKDSETADWLHGALEKYRVPRALVGQETKAGTIPAHFNPIFRDRHELAASGDLGQTIREALAASRALIVLCSPDAAQSRWTNEEILAFKKVHPTAPVLAAIVDGEPFASEMPGRGAEECFPPALRQRFDSRGRPTGKRAEPIAADLRANGDGRQLGLLKIVAGLLDVGLDDLVRRDQQRKHRRLTYIAAASLAGMVLTSGLAVFAFDKRDEARDQRREAEGLVGFMLGDLRDRLEPIGRLDALDAVGSRALDYYQKQDKAELPDASLVQRSKALTLMGEIANTRGDLDRALKLYQEAFASTAESVRRYPDDPGKLFDHAQNVFYVGQIAYQRGDLKQAESAWREYQTLANRMVDLAPANNTYRLEQVYSKNSLGSVLVDLRRYKDAVEVFRSSVSIAESLAAAEPNNRDYQIRLSNTLAWLADSQEYSGELESGLAVRERQLRLLTEMHRRDARDTLTQRHMITAHRSIGRLLASDGDISGGLRESQRGAVMSDELVAIEPQNTEWLQASATNRFDLADLQLSSGDFAGAAATTRAACDIAERLVQLDTSVADWKSRFRANCLTLRARISLAQGDAAGALALAMGARKAAGISPKPTNRAILGALAASVGSEALIRLGRADESTAWSRQAIRGIPPDLGLKPREMVEVALLKLRAGDARGGKAMASQLQSMGYLYPAFVRSRLLRAST